LDELLLQRPGGEQAVEIGSEQLGNKVTRQVSWCGDGWCVGNLHVLQWGDEDVAQADNLECRQNRHVVELFCGVPTFSCLKCLSSFSSR
jgi:hypothetical protein